MKSVISVSILLKKHTKLSRFEYAVLLICVPDSAIFFVRNSVVVVIVYKGAIFFSRCFQSYPYHSLFNAKHPLVVVVDELV